MNHNLETKTIILRSDAKDIQVIQYPAKTKNETPETHIVYQSESYAHKTIVHVVIGLWEEDKIINNIVKLK